MVAYNKKKYYIDIVETKPSNGISIIETDCEVDFAPPLDYKEPERVVPPRPSNAPAEGAYSSNLLKLILVFTNSIISTYLLSRSEKHKKAQRYVGA